MIGGLSEMIWEKMSYQSGLDVDLVRIKLDGKSSALERRTTGKRQIVTIV